MNKYGVLMDKNSINQFLTNLSQKVCEKRIDKHDMKTLETISFSDEAYYRAMVAKLLVNSETKKSEEILLRLVRDKDSLVRTEACDSLCFSRSDSTYDILKKVARKDKNGMVRGYAIMSLYDIATQINREAELNELLQKRLLCEKVVFTRISIFTQLYKLGNDKYLEELIALIKTSRYQNRCAVVNSLDEIIDDSNRQKIIDALSEQRKRDKSFAVISTIDKILDE